MSRYLSDAIFGHAGIRTLMDDAAVAAAMIEVEIALAQVQAGLGLIPAASAQAIGERLTGASVDLSALHSGVKLAGVPVPALLTSLRARLEPQDADWLHYGATSQDVIDTAFSLCFARALDVLGPILGRIIDLLEGLSSDHAETLMLGRTRGQVATPITFGLRVAQWARPLIAVESDLNAVRQDALRVQLGGASGSRNIFGAKGGALAAGLAETLGLVDSTPWHTDRRGLRRLTGWLSEIITALAKIGEDVAVSTRGEVGELSLATGGSSSTMPHKSNPVAAESLQTLTAIATACQAGLAASSVHAEERDGTAWPVEWMLIPMLFEATGAAMDSAVALLEGLQVNTGKMRELIDRMPEVKAEAATFALAPVMGRVAAAGLVKETLKEGQALSTLADRFPQVAWDAALSDASFTEPAAETARAIFAARAKS